MSHNTVGWSNPSVQCSFVLHTRGCIYHCSCRQQPTDLWWSLWRNECFLGLIFHGCLQLFPCLVGSKSLLNKIIHFPVSVTNWNYSYYTVKEESSTVLSRYSLQVLSRGSTRCRQSRLKTSPADGLVRRFQWRKVWMWRAAPFIHCFTCTQKVQVCTFPQPHSITHTFNRGLTTFCLDIWTNLSQPQSRPGPANPGSKQELSH